MRLVAAGAMAAALAALLALAPWGGGATAQRAADIAKLPATAPAPGAAGTVLRVQADGVRFPNWGPRFGWHATGMRNDSLGDRRTTTVFYEHEGHRLAYTVVSGAPLAPPADARLVVRGGVRMSVSRDPSHGGHDVAVFERNGHTCVVAGHVIHRSTLLELAAWRNISPPA